MTKATHYQEVVVIGAGRVGKTLATLFRSSGIKIAALTCRNIAQAEKAQKFVGEGVPLSLDSKSANFQEEVQNLTNILSKSSNPQLLILSPKDDVLPELAERISKALGDRCKQLSVMHCSGGLGLQVLESFHNRDAKTGALHPTFPFSKPLTTLPREQYKICFTYAGDEFLGQALEQNVIAWGGNFIWLKTIDREAYHAANVLASGHLVALLNCAAQLLMKSGLNEEETLKILASLGGGAVQSLFEAHDVSSLREFITGPFVRGDALLIEKHRLAISRQNPSLLAVYDLLGILTKSF